MKTLTKLLPINLVWISFTMLMVFFFSLFGPGLLELMLGIFLFISPFWLLIIFMIPQSKKIKILNFITTGICFLIGVWLVVDLKTRPVHEIPVPAKYTLVEKVQSNSEKTSINGVMKDTITIIDDRVIVYFDDRFINSYFDKPSGLKLDSVKLIYMYKIDIFGEESSCGIYCSYKGEKIKLKSLNR